MPGTRDLDFRDMLDSCAQLHCTIFFLIVSYYCYSYYTGRLWNFSTHQRKTSRLLFSLPLGTITTQLFHNTIGCTAIVTFRCAIV